MIKKILGLTFTVLSATILYGIINPESLPVLESKKGKSFYNNVEGDLDKLRFDKRLPSGWDLIKNVSFEPKESEKKPYMNNIRSLFPINSEGRLELVIEVVELDEKDLKSVIFQMSLFDINSKNKIWELGRTYQLNGNY